MKRFFGFVAIFYSLNFAGFFWILLGWQFATSLFIGHVFDFNFAVVRSVRGSIAAPLIFTILFSLGYYPRYRKR